MEGSPLFNPGFLGSTFIWWVGQVTADSVWRDNILAGKYKTASEIPGWGYRYKVRILGVHDQGQTTIPDEELPWAQVMYPVTAGGGQANVFQTSALRQGMMVFGFWLDGQNMQTPVIMGVLGNNPQTALGTTIGKNDDSVTNAQPGSLAKSGYAKGQDPPTGTAQEKVPSSGLVVEKPKKPDVAKDLASSAPGTKLNKYGLAANRAISKFQAADIENATAQAEKIGLEGASKLSSIAGSVQQGIANRAAGANSPDADAAPGATLEASGGGGHQQTAFDVKLNDKYTMEKIVLMKPDDIVGSATKAIQTEIDNLSAKVDKFMGSRKNYIDAVSGPLNREGLDKELQVTAEKVSKFQKIIMDKVAEYQSKKLNKELAKTVAAMPSSMRAMFGDQKFLNTEENIKQFNGLTNKLTSQLTGILSSKLNIDSLVKQADELAISGALWADSSAQSAVEVLDLSGDNANQEEKPLITTPKVPVCYAEDVVAQAIALNKDTISGISSSQFNNYNRFIGGVQSQLEAAEKEVEARAFDKTSLGKVLEISDEEEDDLPIGGTNYYTDNGVPCAGGNGTGFKVDIVVSTGGWYDSGFATINDEGAGYTVNTADSGGPSGTGSTTGATVTGGSGSGLKLNYTISGGKITGISTNTVGANYKDGDVLTIVNNAAATPSTNATFTIDKVRGTVDTIENGGITIADPGSGYKMGDFMTVTQDGSGNNCGVMVVALVNPGEKKATAGPVSPGDTSGSVADSIPQIGQKLGSILPNLSGMLGNMTQALDFENLKTNIFPFEVPPNPAVSDFYTLATGGASQGETEVPSANAIRKAIPKIDVSKIADAIPEIPFAEPGKGAPDIKLISQQIGGLGSGLTKQDVDEQLKQAQAGLKAGLDQALDTF